MPTLLTVAGSLRADSWNAKVLAQAAATVPSGWSIDAVTLHDIPLYNQDLEVDGAPAGVAELRAAVTTADAVLWSSPQYNHGVSGVVKNALDWLSRPAFAGVLVGKPTAVIAVTPSAHQPMETLGQTEFTLEMCGAVVVRPGVAIGSILEVTDASVVVGDAAAALSDLVARLCSATNGDVSVAP